MAVNDAAVGMLARAAADAGSRLLHLSTDFVFDGKSNRAYRPNDAAHPLGVYGESKLGGEGKVMHSGSAGIVLRTAWVYAATGRNFVFTMLRLMRERAEVRVVADQIGTPTWAAGLARAIWELMEVGAPAGIYHWTDLGVASWYDFAVAIQEEALARRPIDSPGVRRAHLDRRIPDARQASRLQRAQYRGDSCAGRDARGPLAPQFEEDVG